MKRALPDPIRHPGRQHGCRRPIRPRPEPDSLCCLGLAEAELLFRRPIL